MQPPDTIHRQTEERYEWIEQNKNRHRQSPVPDQFYKNMTAMSFLPPPLDPPLIHMQCLYLSKILIATGLEKFTSEQFCYKWIGNHKYFNINGEELNIHNGLANLFEESVVEKSGTILVQNSSSWTSMALKDHLKFEIPNGNGRKNIQNLTRIRQHWIQSAWNCLVCQSISVSLVTLTLFTKSWVEGGQVGG